MPLRLIHRGGAALLLLFIVAHLANHLIGLIGGVAAHQTAMTTLRAVYRQPLVEALLIAALLMQIVTGATLWWRGRGRARGAIAKAQRWSGTYLLLFLINHVGAVLGGRWLGLDTNIDFAAAGLHAGGLWPLFFAPYYALALAALGTHLAAAAYWLGGARRPGLVWGGLMTGSLLGGALVAWMAGALSTITIADAYLNLYR